MEAADDGSTAAYFSLEISFEAPAVVTETETGPEETVESAVDEPPVEPGA